MRNSYHHTIGTMLRKKGILSLKEYNMMCWHTFKWASLTPFVVAESIVIR